MLVDDQPEVLSTMMRVAIIGGWTPLPCRSISDVKSWFGGNIVPSVVVTDVSLSGESGIAIHDWIKATSPSTPVVFITGNEFAKLPSRTLVIPKPFEVSRFLAVIEEAAASALAAIPARAAKTSDVG